MELEASAVQLPLCGTHGRILSDTPLLLLPSNTTLKLTFSLSISAECLAEVDCSVCVCVCACACVCVCVCVCTLA
jgi:hypothetical protein